MPVSGKKKRAKYPVKGSDPSFSPFPFLQSLSPARATWEAWCENSKSSSAQVPVGRESNLPILGSTQWDFPLQEIKPWTYQSLSIIED